MNINIITINYEQPAYKTKDFLAEHIRMSVDFISTHNQQAFLIDHLYATECVFNIESTTLDQLPG